MLRQSEYRSDRKLRQRIHWRRRPGDERSAVNADIADIAGN
jgi:hypothetical protein